MPTSKRRTSVGVLFWIALILLVLVIFLANRSNIEQVLDSTGVVEVVRDRLGADDPAPEPEQTSPPAQNEPPAGETPATEPPARDPEPQVRFTGNDPVTAPAEPDPQPATEPVPAPTQEPEPAPATDPAPESEPRVTTPIQRAPSPDPSKPNRLMAGLYYIRVTDDGRTFPQRVIRPVYYASSPLTETINSLIGGPTGEELNEGLLNLIPDGTELISAQVRNETAYLNFNEQFRFNPLGAEGTVAQLLQIIYSSTEFPTVNRVQFLVNGEALDYLGGDGIFVGEPLGRDAFS